MNNLLKADMKDQHLAKCKALPKTHTKAANPHFLSATESDVLRGCHGLTCICHLWYLLGVFEPRVTSSVPAGCYLYPQPRGCVRCVWAIRREAG